MYLPALGYPPALGYLPALGYPPELGLVCQSVSRLVGPWASVLVYRSVSALGPEYLWE